MLVAGLFGGVLFDRWRPVQAMLVSRWWSAAFSLLPVVGYYISGLSITAADRRLGRPRLAAHGLLAGAAVDHPTLVRDRDGQQAINGLFDATYRIARLVGPMVAALLHLFMPVIHFLTATAIGFLVSGAAIRAARDAARGRAADPVRMKPGLKGAWEALTAGFRLMLSEPATGAVAAGQRPDERPVDGGAQPRDRADRHRVPADLPRLRRPLGLRAGDGRLRRRRRLGQHRRRQRALPQPLSTMFLGYVAMGTGFSWLAASVWLLPATCCLPAMMIGGLFGGLGGPFFFVPMITRMQTVFHGHDIARVFRFRLVVMAAAMLVSSVVATWCFELMGAVATQLACGILIFTVGAAGHLVCRRHERRERRGSVDPVPSAGE